MTGSAAQLEQIRELRARMQQMSAADEVGRELGTIPALSGLVELRAGGSYGVDGAGMAMALMAGPSQAGAWCAVVGVNDFGVAAAVELGIELRRTVLVPDPGEAWLEVLASMIDVATVVVLRPSATVSERTAERVAARLRKRSAALVVWGDWPRCTARLCVRQRSWAGVGAGDGHLVARRMLVEARRPTGPVRRQAVWFPDHSGLVRRDEQAPIEQAKNEQGGSPLRVLDAS